MSEFATSPAQDKINPTQPTSLRPVPGTFSQETFARLPLQELESYLWGAAVLLRGLVDAGDYKQYVFPLLFYKRLSDVWDEEFNTALAETDDNAYARATANDRFVSPMALTGTMCVARSRMWDRRSGMPCVPSKPPIPTGWRVSLVMRPGATKLVCPTTPSKT